MNTVELNQKYHISRATILKYIDNFQYTKKGRIYDINEDSFLKWYKDYDPLAIKVKWNRDIFKDINTPEKAYWLGFIVADGCLHESNYCLSIDIGGRDEQHLEKFIHFIGGDKSFIQTAIHPQTSNELKHIQITSKEAYNDLLNLGVKPRKSGKETFISTPYNKDFIRGLIDGDGYIREDLTEIGLVGSYEMLAMVQEVLKKEVKVEPNKICEHGIIYRISYRSKEAINKIINYLYKDCCCSLDRKQYLANQIIK